MERWHHIATASVPWSSGSNQGCMCWHIGWHLPDYFQTECKQNAPSLHITWGKTKSHILPANHMNMPIPTSYSYLLVIFVLFISVPSTRKIFADNVYPSELMVTDSRSGISSEALLHSIARGCNGAHVHKCWLFSQSWCSEAAKRTRLLPYF